MGVALDNTKKILGKIGEVLTKLSESESKLTKSVKEKGCKVKFAQKLVCNNGTDMLLNYWLTSDLNSVEKSFLFDFKILLNYALLGNAYIYLVVNFYDANGTEYDYKEYPLFIPSTDVSIYSGIDLTDTVKAYILMALNEKNIWTSVECYRLGISFNTKNGGTAHILALKEG